MGNKKFAIVGCGAAAEKYYLPVLKELEGKTERLYCVDRDINVAKNFAARLKVQQVADDYHEIIDKVDGAFLTVPPALHHPIAMSFLEKKVNVLCEKPLADNYKNAKQMVESSSFHNVALCVNNTRRLFPNFKKAKELISIGAIGEIKSIQYFEANKFAWESVSNFYVNSKETQKGVWQDLGSHVLDLICWWLDKKPDLVSFQDDSYGGPESLARMEAETDNCKIEVLLNRHVDIGDFFIIIGDKGRMRGRLSDFKCIELKTDDGRKQFIKTALKKDKHQEFSAKIVENFLKVVLGDEKPLIPGEAVLPSIKLIDECYQNRIRYQMPWNENLEKLLNG